MYSERLLHMFSKAVNIAQCLILILKNISKYLQRAFSIVAYAIVFAKTH